MIIHDSINNVVYTKPDYTEYNTFSGEFKVEFPTPSERQIEQANVPLIKRIQSRIKKGTEYTTIIWADGSTPTVVKRAKDDPNDLYFAVASAIAIKMYGSNSAFKRTIESLLR